MALLPPERPLLSRGVYRAPVLGPNYEVILFAVDSSHRVPQHGRAFIPEGGDLVQATAALWRLLDAVDAEFSRRRLVRQEAMQAAS